MNNYGGVPQAYALQRAVSEQFGAETELIDYRNRFIRFTDLVRLFPVTPNPSEFVSGLKTLGQRFSRRSKFGYFTKRYSKVSGKYLSYARLAKYPPQEDKYICGSDQIWNPMLTAGVSAAYFIEFVDGPEKKIAYAPSFGTDGVPKASENKIGGYLKRFGYLSVREQSGRELVKRLAGKDTERLIDPTFLLEKERWAEIAVDPLKTDEPYILLYIMQKDAKIYERFPGRCLPAAFMLCLRVQNGKQGLRRHYSCGFLGI